MSTTRFGPETQPDDRLHHGSARTGPPRGQPRWPKARAASGRRRPAPPAAGRSLATSAAARCDRRKIVAAPCRAGSAARSRRASSMSPSAVAVGLRAAIAAVSASCGGNPAFALRQRPALAASRSASRHRRLERRIAAPRLVDQRCQPRCQRRRDRTVVHRPSHRQPRIDRLGRARLQGGIGSAGSRAGARRPGWQSNDRR